MNRYKVEIRTDNVLGVEARSESGAEEKALRRVWAPVNCDVGLQSSHVTGITNLSDPTTLVADLACKLQWCAFRDGICKFCGAGELVGHAKDCVLGRARHFLDESK